MSKEQHVLTRQNTKVGAHVLLMNPVPAWDLGVRRGITNFSLLTPGAPGTIKSVHEFAGTITFDVEWHTWPPSHSEFVMTTTPPPLWFISDGAEVCDYCNSLGIKWEYEVEPFEFAGIHYQRGWNACEPCASLIELRNWGALTERVTHRFKTTGMMETITPKTLAGYKEMVRMMAERLNGRRPADGSTARS